MAHQYPTLPPLYFAEKKSVLLIESGSSIELPSEVLHQCLTQYADWGDLAKLACVQSSWSSIMYDAANMDNQAKWELAQALLNGTNGLEANPEMAMKLLLELANVPVDKDHMPMKDNDDTSDNCFAPAMKKIADCYLNGTGVKQDSHKGVAWLESSHILGNDVDAAHELALIYEYGSFNVEIDVVAAAEWFRKAAEAGHMEAMAELGLCYELGCGVEQSDEDALEWYMKAANKGHLTARFAVGEAFEEARGVPQSDEEACLWYHKAAVEGDEDSRKALRRLEDIARIVVGHDIIHVLV